MIWTKRIAAMFVAFVAIVALTATPAHAAWECPSGAICIYDSTSGGWPSYYWTSGGPCINIGPSWNDRASSVYNRAPSHINAAVFYEHAGCTGDGNPDGLVVPRGGQRTFGTGSGLTQYNNMISSIYLTSPL